MNHPTPHLPPIRFLLRWIDSNELPWTFPLPPWCPSRARALRRLRIFARARLRDERVALQGWPRTLSQAVFWPFIAAVKAVRSFVDYPSPSGPGFSAHLHAAGTRWWLQVAHNLRISDQADLFLHLPAHACRATSFITCRETQALINLARLRVQGFADIHRKNPFARFCTEHRLPTAAALMTGQGASITSSQPIPPSDLFLKLANSGKGEGAEIVRRATTDDGWRGADDTLITEAGLADYAARRLGDEQWIFQERLQNAPSWSGYTPEALATVRVITARLHPAGPPECLAAFLRLPRKNAMVDNLSAGGLGATINRATGELGPARSWVDVCISHDHHPDTGARITGSRLPGWDEVRELALRAHVAAGDWLAIGWDVTLTARGPILVEANLNWATPPFEPIEDTRFIEIMSALFFPGK